LLASTNMTAHAQSKGDQALLDALVRKGVLTEKEAEEVSAETAREVGGSSAGKIQIGDWVKALKLSGDLRLRYQWDQREPMILTNPKLGPQDVHIPRERWRFRLRLNADFKLAGNFFGGVQLATSDNRAADTRNATYLHWRPTDRGALDVLLHGGSRVARCGCAFREVLRDG
jgi:hypothetical protein